MTTQRVLVTAGGSGIGLAIARAFLADGADVHVCDLDANAVAPVTEEYGTISTKWGLVGFTKTLALELGQFDITANTIHLGAVEGPRIERVMQGRAEVSGRSAEEETRLAFGNQAIQRFFDPDDIAALALFLAGQHARSISGQIAAHRWRLQGRTVAGANVEERSRMPSRGLMETSPTA